MFLKRLKKSTPQQDAEFRERMEQVPFLDKLIMIGTAFVVIVLPCLAVIVGMSLLVMWILGML
ncbi:MAG: hypothetical protein MRZ54_02765 [Clostridiales bacterium]|nr:hypothetical protein [Clostridiales bacterium]